jgi:hypothetical protein
MISLPQIKNKGFDLVLPKPATDTAAGDTATTQNRYTVLTM